MKKQFLSILFVMIMLPVFSQTVAEKLEKAVRMYNDIRDFEDGLKPGTVKETDIDKMKASLAEAQPLLEYAVSNGTSEEAKTARYFLANFNYEIGFIYGMMGRNRDAYDRLSMIKDDYAFFSNASNFPLRYVYDGKNYAVKFENFSPTLSEYYTGMGEICTNLSKYDEALTWVKKSLDSPGLTDWYKYISLNKLLEIKKKQNVWDKEVLDAGLQQLRVFSALDSSYRRTIRENNYPTQVTSCSRMDEVIAKNPSLGQGEYHRGEAAPLLVRLEDETRALSYYAYAIAGGYADSKKEYLFNAAFLAKKNNNTQVGLIALDKLMEKQPGYFSCGDWDQIAELYKYFGESSKASTASSKASVCRKAAADEERKRKKRERRQDLSLGVYAGFYPGPVLCRYGHYRDFGAVAGFMLTKKMAVEFSYKKINLNHVLMEDMSFKGVSTSGYGVKWNGFKAHMALKFANGNTEGFYIGPLFGYASRELEPMTSNVTNETTGFTSRQDFHASEKSYELFLNYGMMMVNKHLMLDMFMGFGASMYQFSVTDTGYDNDAFLYEHPLLESRKPTRFGPVVRMGFTVGLSSLKRYWN